MTFSETLLFAPPPRGDEQEQEIQLYQDRLVESVQRHEKTKCKWQVGDGRCPKCKELFDDALFTWRIQMFLNRFSKDTTVGAIQHRVRDFRPQFGVGPSEITA